MRTELRSPPHCVEHEQQPHNASPGPGQQRAVSSALDQRAEMRPASSKEQAWLQGRPVEGSAAEQASAQSPQKDASEVEPSPVPVNVARHAAALLSWQQHGASTDSTDIRSISTDRTSDALDNAQGNSLAAHPAEHAGALPAASQGDRTAAGGLATNLHGKRAGTLNLRRHRNRPRSWAARSAAQSEDDKVLTSALLALVLECFTDLTRYPRYATECLQFSSQSYIAVRSAYLAGHALRSPCTTL